MNGPRFSRRQFTALTGAAALALPSLAKGSEPVARLSGAAFGTGWRVSLPADVPARDLLPGIEAVLAGIDRQMSPWRRDSDISRFNAAPAGTHPLPDEALHVVRAALDIALLSGGAFDPTVGPLVARWGFGPIQGDGYPDWRALTVAGNTLAKQAQGTTVDLCGIAKGRALDLVAAHLHSSGVSDFLIDIGGELLASGVHPQGRAWRAGIESPGDPGWAAGVVALTNRAIATSGTGRNGVRFGNRNWSHIVDPASRQPVETGLVSVSVIAPSAMMADGWATALLAAGDDRGPELAGSLGIAALFLSGDGHEHQRMTTGGFDDHSLA